MRWLTPALALALALPAGAGCARPRARGASRAVPLPVEVYAERPESGGLAAPGGARAWLAGVSARPPQVSPARLAPPRPEPPAPEPEPESLPPGDVPGPALAVDPGLKPPVPRGPGRLGLPAGRGRGSVELDVRVDEEGNVSDVAYAGGTADSAMVEAARRCALGMRFYPALRGGRPVAVWCRQRFDFGAAP